MKNPKFSSHLLILPLTFIVVAGLLTSCADEAPPSFVARSYDKSVNMTVDPEGDATMEGSETDGSDDNIAVEESFPIPEEGDMVVDASADDVLADDGSVSSGESEEDLSDSSDSKTADQPATDGGGSKPTFGGSETDFDDDSSNVSDSEAARCAKHFNTTAQKVKIAGKSKSESVSVNAASVVAIKISGNKSRLDLTLDSADGAGVRGVCIFQSGNQTTTQIEISTNIKNFVYYARGNQPTGYIVLTGDAVLENAYFSLAGNGASIAFSSASGQCPSASIRGNGAEFICE
ncbi:MAG: hypothetical protein AB7T49_07440 [Oligoflexales bacterium]